MTEDMIDLARRAVACRGWWWMPGMLVLGGDRITENTLAVLHGVVPDLTDAATLGCLLALVREAWDDEGAYTMPQIGSQGGGWDLWACPPADGNCPRGTGDTEAEALVAALEAAPKRGEHRREEAR